jgi:hypothetical protein
MDGSGSIRSTFGVLHLQYPGTDQRNGILRHQHLDFRAIGGYVLLPPSLIRTPKPRSTDESGRVSVP